MEFKAGINRDGFWTRLFRIFKLTSPCCNAPMESVLNMELDKLQYECNKCKTNWI